MPRKDPPQVEVATAVKSLLRRGLPATPDGVAPSLLNLRGIVARAVDPGDSASLTVALDGTMRGLLARFPDARYATAARVLFGLPPAEPGNLTTRREQAAEQAGHEVHYFRKRIEPKLIDRVAWELLADSDRFSRSPLIAPRLAPIASRQPIQEDPFAWEVTAHEEQLSRVWAAIYAARAELVAVERLHSLDADPQVIIRSIVTAAWRWATARAEALSYATAAAPDSEVSPDDLVGLAGWTPELTESQLSRLTQAALVAETREEFVTAMHQETDIGRTWIDGFMTPPAEADTSDENGTLS